MKKLALILFIIELVVVSNIFASTSFVDLCKNATTINAVKNAIANGADVNEVSTDGITALMSACENKNMSSTGIVNLLLSSGANINATDSLGNSAIDYAKKNTKYGKKITVILEKAKAIADKEIIENPDEIPVSLDEEKDKTSKLQDLLNR